MEEKELLKPSFILIVLGILLFGFLFGYSIGKGYPAQSPVYAQAQVQANSISEQASNTKSANQTITIQKGDTLWKIASTYFPTQPPEDVIHYLRKLNGIENDKIKVGDTLRLS